MPSLPRLIWFSLFVSAGVLGFEIALMRVLLVASWHHLAFLVISIALLGFGASGTILCLCRRWMLEHSGRALFALGVAAAVSMPLSASLAAHVPLESRFLPALFWQQMGHWLLLWLMYLVPFLLGATALGLSLMTARGGVGAVYAGNLVGSGIGALGAPILMSFIPPAWLPVVCGLPVLAGAVCLARPTVRPIGAAVACVLVTAVWLQFDPPRIRPDPYKYRAQIQRLEEQGSARLLARAHSARGTVECFRGAAFHDIPFLATDTVPPPLDVVLVDGHWAGSILRIDRPEQANFLRRTLMAVPYDLAAPQPGVLLLGATGGLDIWLAVQHKARSIHAVQGDANVASLLRGPLREKGGSVLDLPGVRTVIAEPRHFVEHATARFDLIQLVQLQSLAAGSVGMAGLAEDHLITLEGIAACLRRLEPEGLLFVCRGIQTPPRDNLKLLATFVESLCRSGVDPARHIVIVRDYLAVCIVVKASPWRADQIERIRAICTARELTPVWFPGVRPEELNTPDALETGPGGMGDWYHHAAIELFSPRAADFIDRWLFDIRPPTDDRPFFFDFSRLSSIGVLKRAFGPLWITHTELAFLFVLGAIVLAGGCAGLLTVVPLLFLRSIRHAPCKIPTAAFFAAIGLAYLLLEMTVLSRLTLLIGDPVRAAAVTIAAFLILSGLGSAVVQRFGSALDSRLPRLMMALVLVGLVETSALLPLASLAGSLPFAVRSAVAITAIAPLAFLMGMPMPAALSRLDRTAPGLIPWAWGLNGFASVLAVPLATAIGMCWGYRFAAGMAILFYLAAAGVLKYLPRLEVDG